MSLEYFATSVAGWLAVKEKIKNLRGTVASSFSASSCLFFREVLWFIKILLAQYVLKLSQKSKKTMRLWHKFLWKLVSSVSEVNKSFSAFKSSAKLKDKTTSTTLSNDPIMTESDHDLLLLRKRNEKLIQYENRVRQIVYYKFNCIR